MSIDVKLWRQNLRSELRMAADKQFQRENWFGLGNRIDSPSDVYNRLFSDLGIEEFITCQEIGLDEQRKAAGSDFVAKLRAFEKVVDPELRPEAVIDHPKWIEIRRAAQRFLDALG
jgi:hypothetical protein